MFNLIYLFQPGFDFLQHWGQKQIWVTDHETAGEFSFLLINSFRLTLNSTATMWRVAEQGRMVALGWRRLASAVRQYQKNRECQGKRLVLKYGSPIRTEIWKIRFTLNKAAHVINYKLPHPDPTCCSPKSLVVNCSGRRPSISTAPFNELASNNYGWQGYKSKHLSQQNYNKNWKNNFRWDGFV